MTITDSRGVVVQFLLLGRRFGVKWYVVQLNELA